MRQKQVDGRRRHLVEMKVDRGEGRRRQFGAHAVIAGGKPKILGNASADDVRRLQNTGREGIHRHAKGRDRRIGSQQFLGRFGCVVDYLDFYLARWHWPAFNVADSAITVGALLLVLEGFVHDERRARAPS